MNTSGNEYVQFTPPVDYAGMPVRRFAQFNGLAFLVTDIKGCEMIRGLTNEAKIEFKNLVVRSNTTIKQLSLE